VRSTSFNSVVGVAVVTVYEPASIKKFITAAVPVFNLIPAPGEPARFGFYVVKDLVVLDAAIRTVKTTASS